jgi:hypothetical protein
MVRRRGARDILDPDLIADFQCQHPGQPGMHPGGTPGGAPRGGGYCHTLICFTCLCACLHTLPGVVNLPHYPQCIYLCSLFVCGQFLLFYETYQYSSSSCFLVLTFLPALTLSLPVVLDLLNPIWITDLCLPLTCCFAPV